MVLTPGGGKEANTVFAGAGEDSTRGRGGGGWRTRDVPGPKKTKRHLHPLPGTSEETRVSPDFLKRERESGTRDQIKDEARSACLSGRPTHLLLQPSDGASEGVLVDLDRVNDALSLVGVAQRRHGLLQETHPGPCSIRFDPTTGGQKRGRKSKRAKEKGEQQAKRQFKLKSQTLPRLGRVSYFASRCPLAGRDDSALLQDSTLA